MDVLKKLKASTLMETLVATVLIIIIFMLASMILNNLFSNQIKSSTNSIRNHLYELQYLNENKALQLPYTEQHKEWKITIYRFKDNEDSFIEIEAMHSETKKIISIIQSENL